jgi:hypothetical protein
MHWYCALKARLTHKFIGKCEIHVIFIHGSYVICQNIYSCVKWINCMNEWISHNFHCKFIACKINEVHVIVIYGLRTQVSPSIHNQNPTPLRLLPRHPLMTPIGRKPKLNKQTFIYSQHININHIISQL